MENDKTDNSENFEALEKEIREAVAKGVHTRETVRRLTLNAMNAQHIDLASLQRIVAAIMHGIHDGAEEQIQRVISQTQTACAKPANAESRPVTASLICVFAVCV